jgi:hypothetical protein
MENAQKKRSSGKLLKRFLSDLITLGDRYNTLSRDTRADGYVTNLTEVKCSKPRAAAIVDVPGAVSVSREIGDPVTIVIGRNRYVVTETKVESFDLTRLAVRYVPDTAAIHSHIGFVVTGVVGGHKCVEAGESKISNGPFTV